MNNLFTVAVEAHHQERNHHRRYEIVVGRDLLGDWTVAVRYGRAGTVGREQRYALLIRWQCVSWSAIGCGGVCRLRNGLAVRTTWPRTARPQASTARPG